MTPVLIFLILLVGVVFFLFSNRKDGGQEGQIKEGQIQITKGDEVIIINHNGLVEYKSKDRQYSETWDASQISSFFSLMEEKARNYLAKRTSGGDCGYKVFMFLDKKLVMICLDSNDQDMTEIVEPIFIKYSDINLDDYFGNDDNPIEYEEEFSGNINFPTPTIITYLSPTPTPYMSSGGNTNYAPIQADCESWSKDIVNNKAIISNTFCTVNSTPTPTP